MDAAGVRAAATEFASWFDASRCTVSAAELVLREVSAAVAALESVRARAAARVAESGRHHLAGRLSAEEHLAREAGLSVGQARTLVATGKRLELLPGLREAADAGVVSPAQTALIADAAAAVQEAADPQAGDVVAGRLLAQAGELSHGELKSECAGVKAAADADPAATRERIHRGRSRRRWDDGHGTGFLQLSGPLELIVLADTACAAKREELFQQAHRDGRRERHEALDFDAMLATLLAGAAATDGSAPTTAPNVATTGATQASTLTDAAPSGTPRPESRRVRGKWWNAKVIVRVDYAALCRGRPVAGELCEIAGAGPVPVAAVQEILAEGGFLAAVVTQGEQVAGVAHLGRRPTAKQRTALQWISPICSRLGCNRLARQADHRLDWARTRHTLLDELDHLCDADHDLKTHHGWALVPGTGRRAFVPPDDPRHPSRAGPDAERP